MRKTAVYILAILIILLPFHPFLSTFFGEVLFSGDPIKTLFVKSWKEISIVLFFIFAILHWSTSKNKKSIDFLDISILLFVLISAVTGILFTGNGYPDNIPQVVWGAKYGILFLLVFLFVRHISFSQSEKNDLVNAALFSGCVVIIFGILQATVLPEEFLVDFGYNKEYGNTKINGGISYCHKIENTITHQEFCRVQSTLSGPNQLGAYLLILLPLFLYRLIRSKNIFSFLLYLLPLISGFFVLLLTWSRSAWIGAIAILATFFVLQARRPVAAIIFLCIFGLGMLAVFLPAFMNQWDDLKLQSLIGAVFFLILLLILFTANFFHTFFSQTGGFLFPALLGGLIHIRSVYGEFFWNIILRPSSTQGHWERWVDGAKYMVQYPFGLGLGDAGPASARFATSGETGFLPESWYLQVGLESGFLGLILFLTILILTGRKILQSKNENAKPIFLGLVGISVASLFLHTWESAVVALSFWILAGVIVASEKNASFLKKITKIFRRFFLKKS